MKEFACDGVCIPRLGFVDCVISHVEKIENGSTDVEMRPTGVNTRGVASDNVRVGGKGGGGRGGVKQTKTPSGCFRIRGWC